MRDFVVAVRNPSILFTIEMFTPMMDGTTLKLAVILLFTGQALSSLQTDKMGPFTMNIKYVEDCGNEDALMSFHIRSRKTSRTAIVIEGPLTLRASLERNITEFNDEFKMRVVWNMHTPSGWKDNFHIFDWGQRSACQVLFSIMTKEDTENIFNHVFDENNIPIGATCRVPAGNYTLAGIQLNCEGMEKAMPKAFFYGSYRAKWLFFYQDLEPANEVGCMAWYFDMVPKTKRNRPH